LAAAEEEARAAEEEAREEEDRAVAWGRREADTAG
jgi:hypothetical protein